MPILSEFGLKDMLPLRLEEPNEGCIRPSKKFLIVQLKENQRWIETNYFILGEDVYCFLAGDPRVNEQTVLAVVHLLMHREHNR